MAGYDSKMLEMYGNVEERARNGLKCLEMAGITRNCWKCLEMAGNVWNGLKLLEMA